MAYLQLSFGSVNRPADVVAPVAQASVDAETVLAGSELDASVFAALGYTIENTGAQTIDWTVYGAQLADFSDEVVVQASATIAAAAFASYTATPPPFRFYRVTINAAVGGLQGAGTLNGVAK